MKYIHPFKQELAKNTGNMLYYLTQKYLLQSTVDSHSRFFFFREVQLASLEMLRREPMDGQSLGLSVIVLKSGK